MEDSVEDSVVVQVVHLNHLRFRRKKEKTFTILICLHSKVVGCVSIN